MPQDCLVERRAGHRERSSLAQNAEKTDLLPERARPADLREMHADDRRVWRRRPKSGALQLAHVLVAAVAEDGDPMAPAHQLRHVRDQGLEVAHLRHRRECELDAGGGGQGTR